MELKVDDMRERSKAAVSLNQLIYFFERLSAWSAGALLVINVADILLGIFMRYVLKSSIVWTEEVARFSLVWLVMLGATGALCHGDHMVIDFVTPKLSRHIQRCILWIKFFITVGILSLVTYLGTVNALNMWKMTTLALNIPKTIPLLSVPVGFALLLSEVILLFVRSFFKQEERL